MVVRHSSHVPKKADNLLVAQIGYAFAIAILNLEKPSVKLAEGSLKLESRAGMHIVRLTLPASTCGFGCILWL